MFSHLFDIDTYTISQSCSIKEAIKKMDKAGIGFIASLDEAGKVSGIITDGDFRRAILNETDLAQSVLNIVNRDFKYLLNDYKTEEVERLFAQNNLNTLPVIDENHTLVEIISRYLLSNKFAFSEEKYLNAKVVIMAGGKGTRLDPFTRILPKPLIPIGDKSLLEIIIENFRRYNINEYYISVNHKSKIIKSYFEELSPGYSINYLHENSPLGTAGALWQLKDKFEVPIFVTNCDIIINARYDEILNYHRQMKNDITIIGSLKHYSIPYGVLRIENGGILLDMLEKPEVDYLVNTGMYVLNPDIFELIPSGSFYNMTDLVADAVKNSKIVRVYPISENSWIDTGEWVEYKKALEKLGH